MVSGINRHSMKEIRDCGLPIAPLRDLSDLFEKIVAGKVDYYLESLMTATETGEALLCCSYLSFLPETTKSFSAVK